MFCKISADVETGCYLSVAVLVKNKVPLWDTGGGDMVVVGEKTNNGGTAGSKGPCRQQAPKMFSKERSSGFAIRKLGKGDL
ncbi:hypothetical protein TH63_04065 [Rufibacter radiotolerans]|uniref:Uncharacterized protein n=1 Tax=Rufibacter radiotolerans TaxID=1379910 RepID=A0A0H4VH43_9BACT|nr:hypothetical protein TH63_04065 [Rufibacter radiotolerans]